MAFNSKQLNPIATSTGYTKIWVYTDTAQTLTTLKAPDYFANAGEFKVQVNDIIFLIGSDGVSVGAIATLTATTSTIVALTAI